MTEPEQIRVKDAAIMMQYSETTIYRLVKKRILPSRGRGQLLRIPVAAIRAKMQRMEEGEDLWVGGETTSPPAASAAAVPSGPIAMVKTGTRTKTKPAKSADIVRFRET